MEYTAQLFGIIGIILNLLIYQQKTRQRVLVFKLTSNIFWATNFLLLGAYEGMCISLLGILRESVFLRTDRKSPRARYILLGFCVLAVAAAAITWKSPWSILPAIASILSVISFYYGIPKRTRILAIPVSLCMGSYSLSCANWSGVINEILTILSSVSGILRLDHAKHS